MELKEAEEIVKKLLDDGADVHYRDGKFQLNALHVAAEEGYDSIVDLLLRSNATTYVDQQSQDGKTPLFMAVCSGHVDVANLLIGAGADVNYVRRGRTLLSNACQYGHKSVAYRLLVCAQEQENKEGRKRGSLALNKLCFEQGDETRQQLCINIASRYGHVDIVSMLLEEGVNLHWELENDAYTTSLHRACGAGHTYSGRLLLKKAAKAAPSYADRLVNHQDPKGLTALHYAAGGGNSEAVLLLLDEFPCDPNLRNNSGETAIFAAAKAGQEETVAILCRYADRKEGPRVEIDTTANDGQSPLTIAAANGHAGVVRILCLHNAKQPIESDEAQDPLMLAVKSANLAIVKALTAHLSKRLLARHPHKLLKEVKRLERAMAAAKEKETAKKEEGDDQGARAYERVREELDKKKKRATRSSKQLLHATSKDFIALRGPENLTGLWDGLEIPSILELLTWTKEGASFPGQLVPPRPNRQEMSQLATPLGKFIHHQGVVLQKGPFGSKWLRAGCRQDVPWATMWRTLQKYVEALLADAQSKRQGSKGAVYVAVSLISMQSVDFEWLENKGFRFHHYRAPGRGATPDGGDGGNGGANGVGHGSSGRGGLQKNAVQDIAAEIVYYHWPEAWGEDMVPEYATSIEGATGLMLSPDLTKILLVWERGSWSTAGGAVNPGECKMVALSRELREEVSVTVDESWDGVCYLGGWQQGRARDNLINDNFSAFVVRLKSEEFEPDMGEIKEAKWFDVKRILHTWRQAGRPTGKYFETDLGLTRGTKEKGFKDERNKLQTMMLCWLDTWEQGRGLPVTIKREQQGEHMGIKALINADVSKLPPV